MVYSLLVDGKHELLDYRSIGRAAGCSPMEAYRVFIGVMVKLLQAYAPSLSSPDALKLARLPDVQRAVRSLVEKATVNPL